MGEQSSTVIDRLAQASVSSGDVLLDHFVERRVSRFLEAPVLGRRGGAPCGGPAMPPVSSPGARLAGRLTRDETARDHCPLRHHHASGPARCRPQPADHGQDATRRLAQLLRSTPKKSARRTHPAPSSNRRQGNKPPALVLSDYADARRKIDRRLIGAARSKVYPSSSSKPIPSLPAHRSRPMSKMAQFSASGGWRRGRSVACWLGCRCVLMLAAA
jgi:hypothetical protein